jgi:phosphoglycolate phosphatase-like HAD superfamily hydrolase
MGEWQLSVFGQTRAGGGAPTDQATTPAAALVNRLPRVRGLVFDLSGVVHDAMHWRHWLWQVLARLGFHGDQHQFFRDWNNGYLHDVHCGRREFGEAFESFLRSVGLTGGQIDEVEVASAARRRAFEATVRPLPGVRSTVARLHASGIQLAVLANSEHSAPRLRERLARLGLGCHIAAVLSSFDLEQTRPDAVCYQATVSALRLSADEVAFLGHDASDLDGAARAGLATIGFQFRGVTSTDARIACFGDLLTVLGADQPLAAAG